MAPLEFDFPLGWQLGLPLILLTLVLAARSHRRQGLNLRRSSTLLACRAFVLTAIVFLIARPVQVEKQTPLAGNRPVALLLDKSESMSIEEGHRTRHEQAQAFIREHLLPALEQAGLSVYPMLFAEAAEAADATALAKSAPDGKRTNLGGAIAQALAAAGPPLAIVACTDGVATEAADNQRALAALVQARAPFIGVGFGSDQGVQTLSLRLVEAPSVVAPNTGFDLSAYLEAVNLAGASQFDLVLLRDGSMIETKTIQASAGSRAWVENFRLTEPEEGVHQYSVQLLAPNLPGLASANRSSSVAVRIQQEKELRVLFVQGALTWDYKFIGLALKSDPSIKVTGLTRTSSHSVFRQNIETSGELSHGFPATLDEIAPYRVVVLSNLKPVDLTPAQQALLVRYTSELGGGLLMIGGAATFDHSWQGSRLEQMLPVTIANDAGVRGLDQPFRFDLTEQALQHPVFDISDDGATRQAWRKVPTFAQYARVDSSKPAAEVWARHSQDTGPQGRRILMAMQRYGAGQTAILCVQNFWRWRLAKDSDPYQFDRFWKQLFRFLAEARRLDVLVHLVEQDLRPGKDVQFIVERQPSPERAAEPKRRFTIRVENDRKDVLREAAMELEPGRPVSLSFLPLAAGLYSVNVEDDAKQSVASRPVEIRDVNVEYLNTGRNMEMLRQWGSVSGGLAVKVEDCRNPAELVSQIQAKIDQSRRTQSARLPIGINGWSLAALLAALGGEWLLRKRWGLT